MSTLIVCDFCVFRQARMAEHKRNIKTLALELIGQHKVCIYNKIMTLANFDLIIHISLPANPHAFLKRVSHNALMHDCGIRMHSCMIVEPICTLAGLYACREVKMCSFMIVCGVCL